MLEFYNLKIIKKKKKKRVREREIMLDLNRKKHKSKLKSPRKCHFWRCREQEKPTVSFIYIMKTLMEGMLERQTHPAPRIYIYIYIKRERERERERESYIQCNFK